MKNERDWAIIRAYEGGAEPVADIARRFGMTTQGIHALLTKRRIPTRASKAILLRKRRHRKDRTFRVVSPLHMAAGSLVNKRRKSTVGTLSEFVKRTGLTQQALRKIEAGTYDWSLTQMQRICSVVDLTVDQLIASASTYLKNLKNAA